MGHKEKSDFYYRGSRGLLIRYGAYSKEALLPFENPNRVDKEKKGRGFSLGELAKAGLTKSEVRTLNVNVDIKRKSVYDVNVEALKKIKEEGKEKLEQAKKKKMEKNKRKAEKKKASQRKE